MIDKGASVEEVLGKHGLPQIQEREDTVKALLAAAPLDSVSVEATAYSTALQKVRQTAAEFNRKVVALRAKVKKWTDQPRELDEYMEAMFTRSQMAVNLGVVFTLDKKKGFLPDKMEATLAELEKAQWVVPLALRALYFRELVCDLVRFGKVEEAVKVCCVTTGYMSDVEQRDDVERLTIDTLGNALLALISRVKPDITDDCRQNLVLIKELAAGMASTVGIDAVVDDSKLLATLLEQPGVPATQPVADKLQAIEGDDGYAGVLKPMFASEQWKQVLKWASAPAATDDIRNVCQSLREAFDRIQTKVFSAADREQLEQSVAKAFAAMAAGSHLARTTLVVVLPGLVTVARACSMQLEERIDRVCEICLEPGITPLDMKVNIEREAVSFEDVLNKTLPDLQALVEELGDPVSSAVDRVVVIAESLQDMADVAAQTRRRKCLFERVMEAARGYIMAQRAGEADLAGAGAESPSKMVATWSRIKDAEAKIAGPRSFINNLKKLETACGLDARGSELYKQELEGFRKLVRALADIFLTQDSPDAQGSLEAAAKAVKDGRHKVMQASAWSASPAFDRSCVEFAAGSFSAVCVSSTAVEKMRAEPDSYEQLSGLDSKFETFTSWDSSKPMLGFLLEGDVVDKVVEKVMDMVSVMAPVQQAHDKSTAERFKSLVDKMSDLMVDETKGPVPLERFPGLLTQKSIKAIKTLRAEAKAVQASMRKASADMLPDHGDLLKTIEMAKFQTFKWGLAKFMTCPDIKLQTDAGRSLRSKLGEVWGMESLDDGVAAYLGKENCAAIKELIQFDKKFDKKEKAKASKCQEGQGSTAAPSQASGSRRTAPASAQPASKRAKVA